MSSLMKYPKWTRGADGSPVPIGHFIPNRQAAPTTDIVMGKTIQPPPKLPGPLRFASAPPPGNTGPHFPVWRGWRPHRPKIKNSDLPIVMPRSQRGPYFEAWQPSDKWIRAKAERAATTPPYASDSANEVPNYQKYDYFDVEQPTNVAWLPSKDRYSGVLPQTQNVALHGLGVMGEDEPEKMREPQPYGNQMGIPTPPPSDKFPWMWVGIGGAALLLLGKRFYRR